MKTVDVPEDAQRWERPGKTQGKWLYAVANVDTVSAMIFPATMTNEEIVKSIQADELRPRPTFSPWNALRSHEGISVGAIAFVAVGLIGFVWGRGAATPKANSFSFARSSLASSGAFTSFREWC